MCQLSSSFANLRRFVLCRNKLSKKFPRDWIVESFNEEQGFYDYLVGFDYRDDLIGMVCMVPTMTSNRTKARATTETVAIQCVEYLNKQGRNARAVLKDGEWINE